MRCDICDIVRYCAMFAICNISRYFAIFAIFCDMTITTLGRRSQAPPMTAGGPDLPPRYIQVWWAQPSWNSSQNLSSAFLVSTKKISALIACSPRPPPTSVSVEVPPKGLSKPAKEPGHSAKRYLRFCLSVNAARFPYFKL